MKRLMYETLSIDNIEGWISHQQNDKNDELISTSLSWALEDHPNIKIHIDGEFKKNHLIVDKKSKNIPVSHTIAYIYIIDENTKNIQTTYILNDMNHFKHKPELTLYTHSNNKFYHLDNTCDTFNITLQEIKQILGCRDTQNNLSSTLLNYVFAQMEQEISNNNTYPEYVDNLISLGYQQMHEKQSQQPST